MFLLRRFFSVPGRVPTKKLKDMSFFNKSNQYGRLPPRVIPTTTGLSQKSIDILENMTAPEFVLFGKMIEQFTMLKAMEDDSLIKKLENYWNDSGSIIVTNKTKESLDVFLTHKQCIEEEITVPSLNSSVLPLPKNVDFNLDYPLLSILKSRELDIRFPDGYRKIINAAEIGLPGYLGVYSDIVITPDRSHQLYDKIPSSTTISPEEEAEISEFIEEGHRYLKHNVISDEAQKNIIWLCNDIIFPDEPMDCYPLMDVKDLNDK
jgi:hypothetical protein